MPFEVRAVEHEKESEAPVIGRFADAEWWNLTALAHECGFDAGREHERAVYPEESDTHELDFRLAQQLYIGVGVVLNQDVLPFATTWESEDGYIHFRWVKPPEYGGDHAPLDRSGSGEGSDFRLKGAALERLMEHLARGPIRITRVAPES
ncbi:hypothetical protein BH24ACT20_BH24ACT20_13490 [soil metagenome]|jgi:hypothetical protein